MYSRGESLVSGVDPHSGLGQKMAVGSTGYNLFHSKKFLLVAEKKYLEFQKTVSNL